jgi:hypothetical protein
MKPQKSFWAAIALSLFIAGASLQANGQQNKSAEKHQGREKKIRDIDDAIEELERSQKDFDAQSKTDFAKMDRELKASLSKMHKDLERMQAELQKELDPEKMRKEIEQSLAELKKSGSEMEKELGKAEAAKIRAEVEASIAKIDMKKIEQEMKRVKEIDFAKMEAELQNIKPTIEASMKQAREGLEKARQEMTSYKKLVDALDKDGLINKKKAYSIQYKNKQLFIDGKQQSEETVSKYRAHLDGLKEFTMEKSEDNFQIHND